MRRLVYIISLLFISATIMAQSDKPLKGPAAKNYKPWKDKVKDTKIVYTKTVTTQNKLKGPAAKNYKPWKITGEESTTIIVANSKKILNKRTGPAAKNYKPWKKLKSDTIQTSSLVSSKDSLFLR